MKQWKSILALLLLAVACKTSPSSQQLEPKAQLKADIVYLASDELGGRDTGTPGEAMAAEYIATRCADLGLKPIGDSATYFQSFTFSGSPSLAETNALFLHEKRVADSLYYPLNFSGSSQLMASPLIDLDYGIVDPVKGIDDYAQKSVQGHIALIDISSPDGIHPHSAYLDHHDLRLRAERAAVAGAKAVVFYQADEMSEAPSQTLTANVDLMEIPVIFMKEKPDPMEVMELKMRVIRPRLKGKNVVALLDKGKDKTIVIGAHYDHLGHGISGSLHRGEPEVHNGADDNASGVAAMLMIVQDLKEKALDHNVLIIGFSGEERGLLGSNHYVKNPIIPLEQISYMLNMDMVGRLDQTKNRLSVNGVGTSPAWGFIDSTFVVRGLSAVTTDSGTGPSDHMSFYLADKPVLHFFSGTHSDYHKPTDDEALINYDGMMSIIAYMEAIIDKVDGQEIKFTKTKGEEREAAAFKVTLGVVPDYLFEDKGMRIDGVSEGRPGANAGLKKGDVIIKLGQRSVGDIYAYMEGLAEQNSGATVPLIVLRNGQELQLEVTFD